MLADNEEYLHARLAQEQASKINIACMPPRERPRCDAYAAASKLHASSSAAMRYMRVFTGGGAPMISATSAIDLTIGRRELRQALSQKRALVCTIASGPSASS